MRFKIAAAAVVVLIVIFGILSSRVPQLQFVQDAASWMLSPFQAGLTGTGSSTGGFFDAIGSANRLRDENESLREEIARLKEQNVQLGEQEREIAQLREYLDLKKSLPEMRFLEGAVIASDPSSLVRAIGVNVGSDAGVREGMTVLAAGGIVGRVVKVDRGYCRVLLITDTSNSITAIVQSSRAQGVVSGERTKFLHMRYLPQSSTIRVGDRVLTSGLGGVYPPGIVIGTIISVTRRDVDIFQEAVVQPAVDVDALERVLIVSNYIPIKLEGE